MEDKIIREHCHEEDCVKPIPVSETENFPWYPGYAKIPVVLAEFTVQIDTEAEITLDRPAIEIKRVKKNVYLTQCRFIPGTDKVFLGGYIRKNIEYATADDYEGECVSGGIYHTTVKIPFHFVTKVKFNRYPQVWTNSPVYEAEYLNKKNTGADTKETDRRMWENFNEKVYCELEHAEIYEADISEEKHDCDGNLHTFNTVLEKMVVYLTLKLLQNQQVYYFPTDECKKDGCEEAFPKREKDMIVQKY